MRGDNAGLDEQLGFVEGWKKYWRPRLAIGALALGIIGYDMLSPKGDTISEEVWRLSQGKIGRKVVPWLIHSVAGHLDRSIPPDEDWIHLVAQMNPK